MYKCIAEGTLHNLNLKPKCRDVIIVSDCIELL